MFARSVPPPGSVRHAEQSTSPRAIGGSQRCFCSSLPQRRIELAASELATETTDATTQSARASSSQMIP